jgi:hypothetical protein
VSGGNFEINGSQPAATGVITIADGAILSGTGTLGATSVTGVTAGAGTDILTAGTVVTGDPSASVGTLRFASSLSVSDATWLVDLVEDANGVSDLINVTGALTLNNISFSLTRDGIYTPANTYTIAQYTSLTGTFNSLANGAIISGYQIEYGSTAITLTAVPEPATLLSLLGVGSAALWRMRRRKRKQTS